MMGTTRHSKGCWQVGYDNPAEGKIGTADLKLVVYKVGQGTHLLRRRFQ